MEGKETGVSIETETKSRLRRGKGIEASKRKRKTREGKRVGGVCTRSKGRKLGEREGTREEARGRWSERDSPGDQWTQPRGALHSLGYYVVSRCCVVILCPRYVLRPPLLRPPTFPSAVTSQPFPSCGGFTTTTTITTLLLALALALVLLGPITPLPLNRRQLPLRSPPLPLPHSPRASPAAPPRPRGLTASRANFDPPIAPRRRLPRAGKLIHAYTQRNFS